MKFKNEIKDNEIIVFADKLLYSRDSIFKCLYWYTGKFHVNVSLADKETFCISLKPLSKKLLSSDEFESYQLKLERDLIDYNLRDIVTKETKNIRDLLIAKAFSNGEFDEVPPGEVTDPLGFDVNKISND